MRMKAFRSSIWLRVGLGLGLGLGLGFGLGLGLGFGLTWLRKTRRLGLRLAMTPQSTATVCAQKRPEHSIRQQLIALS